ncbi:cathepsin L-like isoform X2 [Cetorhinus maximus]
MFRVAVICLALSFSLLHAETDVEENDIDIEDESELRSKFEKFKVQYKKKYDQAEEEKRFQIFVENLKASKRMQEQDIGTAIYGITKFSDMSDEEFGAFYLNPVISNNNDPRPEEMLSADVAEQLTNVSLPSFVDWRKLGAVTRVKDQGLRCGSCWAFGSVANIESMWYIKTKKLRALSEQGGIMSEREYPYRGRNGHCAFKQSKAIAKIQTYRNIRPDEEEMKIWVAHSGPIVISMNATGLQGYRRGIIRPGAYACDNFRLNHVMLVVGYGTSRGYPYWIIKNSWGADWGEKGYFRIYRGEGACGINKLPITVVI